MKLGQIPDGLMRSVLGRMQMVIGRTVNGQETHDFKGERAPPVLRPDGSPPFGFAGFRAFFSVGRRIDQGSLTASAAGQYFYLREEKQ
jgi:hypothetical protein